METKVFIVIPLCCMFTSTSFLMTPLWLKKIFVNIHIFTCKLALTICRVYVSTFLRNFSDQLIIFFTKFNIIVSIAACFLIWSECFISVGYVLESGCMAAWSDHLLPFSFHPSIVVVPFSTHTRFLLSYSARTHIHSACAPPFLSSSHGGCRVSRVPPCSLLQTLWMSGSMPSVASPRALVRLPSTSIDLFFSRLLTSLRRSHVRIFFHRLSAHISLCSHFVIRVKLVQSRLYSNPNFKIKFRANQT